MSEQHAELTEEQITALRQQHIGRLFLRAHRAYSERAYQKLQALGHSGLSVRHTALLAHLDVEGTPISVLAERAGMTKQSMGELVADLETQGYVARSSSPYDRRATLVQFTSKGQQFLRDSYAIKLEIESEYAQLLGENGLAQLRALLHTLLERNE